MTYQPFKNLDNVNMQSWDTRKHKQYQETVLKRISLLALARTNIKTSS